MLRTTLCLLFLFAATSIIAAPTPAPQGNLYITAPCTYDAECGSSCCAVNTRECASKVFAIATLGGCVTSGDSVDVTG